MIVPDFFWVLSAFIAQQETLRHHVQPSVNEPGVQQARSVDPFPSQPALFRFLRVSGPYDSHHRVGGLQCYSSTVVLYCTLLSITFVVCGVWGGKSTFLAPFRPAPWSGDLL
jgi:hypothetical protein